jgi:ABC-type transport system substrate-binding protein
MRFVRNPNYDPKTDSPIDRSAYVNGVDIEIDSNTDQILQGVATGRLDGSLLVTPNPSVVGPKPAVRTDPVDSLVYLSLNLLKPPFNDVHVRRAVGLLLNRTALTSVVGGAQPGTPASGIVPPILLGVNDGAPVTGNVAMARAEMARSRYDLDKNGRCDAPVCRAVRYMSTGRLVLTTTLQSELASIGIELKLVEYDGSSFVFPPPFEFPLSVRRLNADYADPATFFELLQSRGIDCFGGGNPSFVGMTRAQAATCNRLPTYDGAAHPTPSLDGRIAACEAMTGAPRTACWGELDRFVTNDLAAWVPLLWPSQPTAVGRTVVRYVFDVSTGMISLCQIAVSNHATMPAS